MRFAVLPMFALAAFAVPVAASAAQGAVEFCPATASVAFPIASAFGTPAKTFGYDLTALLPRTVSVTMIADTSDGWYAWNAGSVTLANTTRNAHMRALPRQFRLQPYVVAASPTLAVTFPTALSIRHLWVTSANGTPCEVPAFDAPSDAMPPDPGDVSALISPLYAVSVATPSQPPFASTACNQPFSAGTVTKAQAPDYPLSLRDAGPLASSVEVALDRDGNLIGAWTYAGSGFTMWDRAALRAALLSKYRGAVSYCRPVNGTYLFLATAVPGGY